MASTAPIRSVLNPNAPDDWMFEVIDLETAAAEVPGSGPNGRIHVETLRRAISAGELRATVRRKPLLTCRAWLREWLLGQDSTKQSQAS